MNIYPEGLQVLYGVIYRWTDNRPNLISAFLKLCRKYTEKTKLNTHNT